MRIEPPLARVIAAGLLALLYSLPLAAQVKVGPLFSDHMVLQRNKQIPIWGTAAPGEAVAVSLSSDHAHAVADSVGRWRASLDPLSAGGPFALSIEGKSDKLVIHDVLIGDVWLASGQSNMQFQVSRVRNADAEIAAANFPQIRQFAVSGTAVPAPADTIRGTWKVATPENVPAFSAVAYFFARRIHLDQKIPVGILNASVGGTPIQAWAAANIQLADPGLHDVTAKKIQALSTLASDTARYRADIAAWESKYNVRDRPAQDRPTAWASPAAELTSWKLVTYPVTAAELGLPGGSAVWFRKDFQVDPAFLKQAILINFGPIGENATLYLNGRQIGAYSPPEKAPGVDKNTTVPPTALHPGTNTLAFRVFSHTPQVTLFGSGKFYLAGNSTLTLAGPWLYRVEFQTAALSPEALRTFPLMPEVYASQTPGTLYNGMIHPLGDYPVTGILWYQGEGNVSEPALYRRLLPAMIADWRRQWADQLPFFIVQLPNYGPPTVPMNDSSWPELREIQAETARTVSRTAIAVTIDIGDAENIHPTDKQDVGERLALLARAQIYHELIEDSGPTYKSSTVIGNAMRILFDHADGFQAKAGPPSQLWISGADRRFYPATASIDGDALIVSSAMVPAPVAVRYAWTDNPQNCNLYNAAGLPALPFRTDTWSPLVDRPR